jgi:rhomboid protease GluP
MQIGNKNASKAFSYSHNILVVLNIVVFAVGMLSGSQTQIIQNYGFIPNHLFSASTEETEINNLDDSIRHDLMPSSPLQQSNQGSLPPLSYSLVTLFTSMFIHANIAHIAFNLLALVYLGGYAERAIGIPRYLLVYFMSGIAAALFHGVIASHIF